MQLGTTCMIHMCVQPATLTLQAISNKGDSVYVRVHKSYAARLAASHIGEDGAPLKFVGVTPGGAVPSSAGELRSQLQLVSPGRGKGNGHAWAAATFLLLIET